MECYICGGFINVEAPMCPDCGAPSDDRAMSGEPSSCAICGEVLWSLAETCRHCQGRGYPALRPRLGDKSLGAPETEIGV